MKKHYLEFLTRAEMPSEADAYLKESIDVILPEYEKELTEIIDFLYDNDCSVKATLPLREKLAEKSGVHLYTVNFIFMVCASKRMKADFLKLGYTEECFWETILDLKYKLFESKTVKGVWGNFVENWYDIFYKCDIFKLGRLEYERIEYPDFAPETVVEDIELKHGCTVYSVHIPSCGKLTKELREESYKQAREFFRKETGDKPLVLFCESWLMNPDNRKIFPPSLNIIDFLNEWTNVGFLDDSEYHDCWRLFSVYYDGKPENLPEDTTMQKCMKQWLMNGGKTGAGISIKIIR